MTATPVVIVAGLGRCGSSLTMQMLHTAGLRCAGAWPAFEPNEVDHRPVDEAWLRGFQGGAVKVLDPHLTPLPAGVPNLTIWLDRIPADQAASQAKFASMAVGGPRPDRQHRRRWARKLMQERGHARAALWAMGYGPALDVRYENLITRAVVEVVRIAALLRPLGIEADVDAMRRCIRKTDPSCAPDLAMEMRLLAEAPPL